MGSEFSFDDDEVWRQATEAAQVEVDKANQKIAARCRALGIPDRFAPSLSVHWRTRGYDNLIDKRKTELRRMATTEIEAMERKAITEIEMSCLDAHTKIAIAGLTSQAAHAFVEALPGVDQWMPRLSYAEIAGETEPPIAEQLVTPNALRQRRFREQKALRNGQQALLNSKDKK